MDVHNTFAKARNANYVEQTTRLVRLDDIPQRAMDECHLVFGGQIAQDLMTKWIDAAQLAALDAAIDQAPFLRVGKPLSVVDPDNHPGISPHGIYGVDDAGRAMGSATIYRVKGGALVTFAYM